MTDDLHYYVKVDIMSHAHWWGQSEYTNYINGDHSFTVIDLDENSANGDFNTHWDNPFTGTSTQIFYSLQRQIDAGPVETLPSSFNISNLNRFGDRSSVWQVHFDGEGYSTVSRFDQALNSSFWMTAEITQDFIGTTAPPDGDLIVEDNVYIYDGKTYIDGQLYDSVVETHHDVISYHDWFWFDVGPAYLFSENGEELNFNSLINRQDLFIASTKAEDWQHAGGGGDQVRLPTTATAKSIGWNFAFVFYGDSGDDTIIGADGSDVVDGGPDSDVLYGGAAGDRLYGGDGEDGLFGETGNDQMEGGPDDDLLDGGPDNDEISGDDGNDTLFGAKGKDTLRGGDDKDTFMYVEAIESRGANADTIKDFQHAQHDKIDLGYIDAMPGGADNTFKFIGKQSFASYNAHHNGGVVRAANGDVQVDIGGNGTVDMTIHVPGLVLVGADFVL